MKKNDREWEENLSPKEYQVLRRGGTEKPFSGELLHNKERGMYKCKACGNFLFSSEVKFDSGTGWPSFSDVVSNENVDTREDISFGMSRVEVRCKKCGSHLGHVFPDGPKELGGKRYCINSVCLEFEKEESSK
jgi:peptide-methionine (R)-S-oxide reductase